ncbi:MAG: four helix bundle protein [Acidobacteriaceae bacterium]|nr:four helix bundle protein [Acidobacteriaceae bacterium]
MTDFRELKVWQKVHRLTLAVFSRRAQRPAKRPVRSSDHVLFSAGRTVRVNQSAPTSLSSIPANLAEGCGRDGSAEFARYCSSAMGSASELEYHLLARDRS